MQTGSDQSRWRGSDNVSIDLRVLTAEQINKLIDLMESCNLNESQIEEVKQARLRAIAAPDEVSSYDWNVLGDK